MGWRHRRRHGIRGRFPRPISIDKVPTPQGNPEPIYIEPAELEALRVVDMEVPSQEAGERVGISRGNLWRLIQSARRKTAQALTEGRPLSIAPFVSECNRSP